MEIRQKSVTMGNSKVSPKESVVCSFPCQKTGAISLAMFFHSSVSEYETCRESDWLGRLNNVINVTFSLHLSLFIMELNWNIAFTHVFFEH